MVFVYLRAIVVGLVTILALSPFPYWDTGTAQLPDSHEIQVVAYPSFQLPPANFTAIKIDDSEALLTWTNRLGATGIEIRAGTSRYPSTILDGRLVFSGSASAFSDISVDLSGENGQYYRAWQIYTGPIYSVGYAQDSVAGSSNMIIAAVILVMVIGVGLLFYLASKV